MELGAKVRRALDALRAMEIDVARGAVAELARRHRGDADIQALRELTEALAGAADLDARSQAYQRRRPAHRLPTRTAAESDGGHEQALRAVAIAIAERAETERGPAARVGGWPVARFYVEAGEAELARKAAEAMIREGGTSARALVCLADSYALTGDEQSRVEARDLYRQAFVLDSSAVELHLVADREVRDLASLAELEYEIEGDPTPWLATVGYLEGVLPIAHIDEAAFARLGEEKLLGEPVVPANAESFYHYLQVSESYLFFGDRSAPLRLEARRRLKAIAPALFVHYLQRF